MAPEDRKLRAAVRPLEADEVKSLESNNRVDKMTRRIDRAKKFNICAYCSPHGGENSAWSKRGAQKRKGKNHRRPKA